jgi:hypothetical protein
VFLRSIHDLPESDELAVIINVGTKAVSTLALMSALRFAQMPVLLVDCESKDGSVARFTDLQKTHPFFLLSAPLQEHGKTLDWIFSHVAANKVLLLDSDAEILSDFAMSLVKRAIAHPQVFGAGYTHGPAWLEERHGAAPNVKYYQERMWIPFSFLKVSFIREALEANHSFAAREFYNGIFPVYRISRLLDRHLPSVLPEQLAGKVFTRLRRNFYGHTPEYVYYDTGADVFQYLKYERGLYFAGTPAETQSEVAHYHGVTRLILDPMDRNGTEVNSILATVLHRLEDEYGVSNK